MEQLQVWRGDRLRTLRKEHGLTQQEVARRLGTNQSLYARFENERSAPTLRVAVRIAHEFNVSLDWLTGLSEMRDPKLSEQGLLKDEMQILLSLRRKDLKRVLYLVLDELDKPEHNAGEPIS